MARKQLESEPDKLTITQRACTATLQAATRRAVWPSRALTRVRVESRHHWLVVLPNRVLTPLPEMLTALDQPLDTLKDLTKAEMYVVKEDSNEQGRRADTDPQREHARLAPAFLGQVPDRWRTGGVELELAETREYCTVGVAVMDVRSHQGDQVHITYT